MTKIVHRISISVYVAIILTSFITLGYFGRSYYSLPLIDRYNHPYYNLLRPSGLIGHGLGIAGACIIIIGLFSYMIRKRFKIFSNLGKLKYWLEFHIFMCTWGTVLALFHTSFKFGGIISIGFWSLVVVWLSGVTGRFIYIQIPRTIEGRELTLNELQQMKSALDKELKDKYKIEKANIAQDTFPEIKKKLVENKVSSSDFTKVRRLIKKEKILTYRIKRLDRMRKVFNYWHFAHLPFALIFLIILAIHVFIVSLFGYNWIIK